jgi:hypothetical protein
VTSGQGQNSSVRRKEGIFLALPRLARPLEESIALSQGLSTSHSTFSSILQAAVSLRVFGLEGATRLLVPALSKEKDFMLNA